MRYCFSRVAVLLCLFWTQSDNFPLLSTSKNSFMMGVRVRLSVSPTLGGTRQVLPDDKPISDNCSTFMPRKGIDRGFFDIQNTEVKTSRQIAVKSRETRRRRNIGNSARSPQYVLLLPFGETPSLLRPLHASLMTVFGSNQWFERSLGGLVRART